MNISLLKTLIWLFVAFLVAIAFQIPMLWHGEYYLLLPNTLIIASSIFYLRNALEFNSVFFHKNKWVRYLIFVLNIVLFIYLMNRLELVMGFVDSLAMENILKTAPIDFNKSLELLNYVGKEYLAFSIASFVAIAVYNVKIFTSFWGKAKVKSERQL